MARACASASLIPITAMRLSVATASTNTSS
nr:MAG TPA: hypothetical protein [Caudoviricetes sp.]